MDDHVGIRRGGAKQPLVADVTDDQPRGSAVGLSQPLEIGTHAGTREVIVDDGLVAARQKTVHVVAPMNPAPPVTR